MVYCPRRKLRPAWCVDCCINNPTPLFSGACSPAVNRRPPGTVSAMLEEGSVNPLGGHPPVYFRRQVIHCTYGQAGLFYQINP